MVRLVNIQFDRPMSVDYALDELSIERHVLDKMSIVRKVFNVCIQAAESSIAIPKGHQRDTREEE